MASLLFSRDSPSRPRIDDRTFLSVREDLTPPFPPLPSRRSKGWFFYMTFHMGSRFRSRYRRRPSALTAPGMCRLLTAPPPPKLLITPFWLFLLLRRAGTAPFSSDFVQQHEPYGEESPVYSLGRPPTHIRLESAGWPPFDPGYSST